MCDLNAMGLTPTATAYLFHIGFSLLLVRAVYHARAQLGLATSLAFLGVSALEIGGQFGFEDVLPVAQKCTDIFQGKGGVEWRDGSSVWLYNIPFAMIWCGAAAWGILAVSAPSADGPMTILLPQSIMHPVVRLTLCLPALGSVYAALFLAGGGSLIKPLSSQLYFFEPVLAATLTLSGFTWLAVAVGGKDLIKIKTWSRSVPFSRLVALFIGASAAYYCVWRLNGGLVLSANQWRPESPLRKAFEEHNGQGETHVEWQHVEVLRSFAERMGVIGLIKI